MDNIIQSPFIIEISLRPSLAAFHKFIIMFYYLFKFKYKKININCYDSSLLFQAVKNLSPLILHSIFVLCCPFVHPSLVRIPALAKFCRDTQRQDLLHLPGPEQGGDDIYWPAWNRSFGVVCSLILPSHLPSGFLRPA